MTGNMEHVKLTGSVLQSVEAGIVLRLLALPLFDCSGLWLSEYLEQQSELWLLYNQLRTSLADLNSKENADVAGTCFSLLTLQYAMISSLPDFVMRFRVAVTDMR